MTEGTGTEASRASQAIRPGSRRLPRRSKRARLPRRGRAGGLCGCALSSQSSRSWSWSARVSGWRSPGRGRALPSAPHRSTIRSGPSPGAGTRRFSMRSAGRCRTRRCTPGTSSTCPWRCGTHGLRTTRPRPATSSTKSTRPATSLPHGTKRSASRPTAWLRRGSSRQSEHPSRRRSSPTSWTRFA